MNDTTHAANILPVSQDADGQRVDNFLAKKLRNFPKALIYKALRTGQIRVNGRRARQTQKLTAGDLVRLPPFMIPTGGGQIRVPDKWVSLIRDRLLYESSRYLVLDKPAGMAVHAGTGVPFGLIDIVRQWQQNPEMQLCHRLDRDTSGCVVIACGNPALRDFQKQMQRQEVKKTYFALLKGHLNDRLDVTARLDVDNRAFGERTVAALAEDDHGGKSAHTVFLPVEHYNRRATLAECDLKTGRTHQIRAHAAHVGHPLAGDDRYGDMEFNRFMRQQGLKRLFLHAGSLRFQDAGEDIVVSAPIPEDLNTVLNASWS